MVGQSKPAPIVQIQLTVDEVCLIQRLRQIRHEALKKGQKRVIIDVSQQGQIRWWVAAKSECAKPNVTVRVDAGEYNEALQRTKGLLQELADAGSQ